MFLLETLTQKSFVPGKLLTKHNLILLLQCHRFSKARVLFNHVEVSWERCMQTCPKYLRAQAPGFSSQEELTELITWAFNTTRDPVTLLDYPDVVSASFWLSFR